MADLDLRPLSLGEILDRTFSLYRNNFLLFVGIAAIPQLLVLALHLATTILPFVAQNSPVRALTSGNAVAFLVVTALVGVVVYIVAYLFAQGGTVFAVSELYLGRKTSIMGSMKLMRGHVLVLLGVVILSSIAIGLATLLLIIPGIWLACRFIVCAPAALLEDLGPGDSLSRSFQMTQDNAGRSFVIYLLYFVLIYAATFCLTFPFTIAAGMSAHNPSAARMWLITSHFGEFLGTVLVTPILTIATAVYYYDLRVRLEAFDLQMMLNSLGGAPREASPSAPSSAS